MKIFVPFIILCVTLLACKDQPSENDESLSVEAKYVLPFPIGREYTCSLGFNGYSHTGSFRYAVDFAMPIGTLVTAARRGHVVYILESYLDDDQTSGHENVVVVRHEDSTYARYAHLTINGALVTLGQDVVPGDTIGISGNSGSSAAPHLHFDITNSNSGRGDQTIPFDFKNTISHPLGMKVGTVYKALPY